MEKLQNNDSLSSKLLNYLKTKPIRKSVDRAELIDEVKENYTKIDSLTGLSDLSYQIQALIGMIRKEDFDVSVEDGEDIEWVLEPTSGLDLYLCLAPGFVPYSKKDLDTYDRIGDSGALKRCYEIINKEVYNYYLPFVEGTYLLIDAFSEDADDMEDEEGYGDIDDALEACATESVMAEGKSAVATEESVNSAVEESYRMIEDIDEFDERVTEAYNTLNSSLGRLPSSNDILEYLQDKYEEYESVDCNPMTLVSYLNAISSTLEEKGLKEGEYVDSTGEAYEFVESREVPVGVSKVLNDLRSDPAGYEYKTQDEEFSNNSTWTKQGLSNDIGGYENKLRNRGYRLVNSEEISDGVYYRDYLSPDEETMVHFDYSDKNRSKIVLWLNSFESEAESYDKVEKELFEAIKEGRTNIL